MSAFNFEKMTPGEQFEFRRAAQALTEREFEALKLYQPMPRQQLAHDSLSRERVVRGSNRAGKTVWAAAEVARIVTGQDPMEKMPKTNGICYCVGYDGRHIGQTMWKKLGKPGAFKIIRDQYTNRLRAFMPWIPEDMLRIKEAKPAPPMIPRRMIKEIAWELKKESQPKIVYLTNGWELHFFSGNAKPPMGVEIDLAWFDEEIPSGEWYAEIAARLVDRRGYFLWSATPQAGTDRLFDLHERAEMEAEKLIFPKTVEEFMLHIDENIHMTNAQREEFKSKLSEDDKDVRIEGEFARIHKVYPEYSAKFHEVPFREVPHTWTRFVAIDPGRQFGSALFMAVSPPTGLDANIALIYDEIYIRNCDAFQFGEAMSFKCNGQTFRAFIIDDTDARKAEAGSGITIRQQYSDQLRRVNVKSEVTNFGFEPGSDDVSGGIESVRMMLRRKTDGLQLRVMDEKVPNFLYEMKRYQYKKEAGHVTEKPRKKYDHLCFTAGTMIETSLGQRPIEKIIPGELAWTRNGYRIITDAMMTCANADVFRIEFSDGRSLVATGNHPVWVENKGWVPVDELAYLDKVSLSIDYGDQLCASAESMGNQRSSFSRGYNTGDIRSPKTDRFESIFLAEVESIFTERFGKTLMEKSRKDSMFTTLTKILSITRSETWSAYQPETISGDIGQGNLSAKSKRSILKKFVLWLLNGIEAMKERLGIANIPLRLRRIESPLSTSAKNVERSLNQKKSAEFGFATSTAKQMLGESQALTISREYARSVEPSLLSIGTPQKQHAPISAHPCFVGKVEKLASRERVFNLTVDGEHEYFANGILVSNCDCLRYLAQYPPRWHPPSKPKALDSPAYRALLAKQKRKQESEGDSTMWGPRGTLL